MIEVGVADEHGLELVLQLEVEPTRQRAGVDRKTVVQDERAGSVFLRHHRGSRLLEAARGLRLLLGERRARRFIGRDELIASLSAVEILL